MTKGVKWKVKPTALVKIKAITLFSHAYKNDVRI